MNSLYIGIGVAIIAALVTALVGPYFVDWTAYRSVFEREGQKIFGENVTVLGQAQVRLLPVPSISLDDVVIGPVDHPNLKIDRLDLKIEPTPLLRGDIRISELRLDRPVMRMGVDQEGKPVMPGLYAALNRGSGPNVGAIGLEFAEIVDGRVLAFDQRNGAETTIDGVNGTASASALSGPLKLDGGASLDGHPFSFRFSTGRLGDDGKWPMRLQVNPAEGPFQLNVETVLDTTGAKPKATGTLTLQRIAFLDSPKPADKQDKFGAPQTPWQLDSGFAADAGSITFDTMQLTVGEVETAYTVTGKGRIDLGITPKFDVQLAAKQIDFDRLIAQKVDEPADPQVAMSRTQDLLLGLPKLPIAGRVQLAVGGFVIGGGAVQDLSADVRTRADGWAIDTFEARLPGRSRVSANGRLVVASPFDTVTSGAPSFQGQMSLASDQPLALLQWWKKGPSAAIEPFSFTGRVAIAADGVKVDELQAKIGQANARGALQWTAATATRGERLKATLSADQLDLDQAKILTGLVSSALGQGGANKPTGANLPGIDLDLDAGSVLVAGQALKGVTAKAAFDGTSLTIDRLTIRDAIGAAIDVKGRIDRLTTTPDGAIDGSIKADRLAGLVHLVDTLYPGQAWVKRLVAAAPALGPFSATARLTGDAGATASNMHLALDGMAATSRLSLTAAFAGRLDQFRQGQIDAALQLDGPDGGLVLRQIGLAAISDSVSTGKLLMSLKGVPTDGLSVTANADVAGSKLTATGRATIDDAGSIAYTADCTLKAADLRTSATLFGQSLPSGGATVPLDVRARVAGTGLKPKLSSLAGHLSDAGVNGGADVDLGQWPIKVDGQLQFTQADLTTLLELGLGSDAFQSPVPKGAVWPSDVLGGPVFSAFNANIDLAADRLTIDATRGIDRFAAKLRLRAGQVLFDGVAGRFASGDLTGALGVATGEAGEVKLSGNLQIKGARLADIVWRRDGRAVADGTMGLQTTFESTGRSIAALASALNGSGAFSVDNGMMRYVDPDAFGAIIAAADGGLELKDDKIRSVFQGRLDAGTLPFQRIEAAFSIAAGVARVNTINVTSPRAQTSGSVAIDFGRWTMDADWTLRVDPGKNGVVGAEPQVGVLFQGPIGQPTRAIDVAPLSAFLTLRAFEREVQHVEDMQQDIVEQQRFQRELKRLKDERVRREQEQKAAELAAKQKAEDDRRAAAEAKKAEDVSKAAEAAKVADDAKKAEEARKAAEAAKAADDARKAADAAKAAEEARKSAEAAKKADNERKAAEAAKAALEPAAPRQDPPLPEARQSAAPADTLAPPSQAPAQSAPAVSGAEPATASPPKPSDDQTLTPPSSSRPPEREVPSLSTATPQVAPIPLPPSPFPLVARPANPSVTTTDMVRIRPKPSVLPDLPPIIFINPRPPITPLVVPTVPSQP